MRKAACDQCWKTMCGQLSGEIRKMEQGMQDSSPVAVV